MSMNPDRIIELERCLVEVDMINNNYNYYRTIIDQCYDAIVDVTEWALDTTTMTHEDMVERSRVIEEGSENLLELNEYMEQHNLPIRGRRRGGHPIDIQRRLRTQRLDIVYTHILLNLNCNITQADITADLANINNNPSFDISKNRVYEQIQELYSYGEYGPVQRAAHKFLRPISMRRAQDDYEELTDRPLTSAATRVQALQRGRTTRRDM